MRKRENKMRDQEILKLFGSLQNMIRYQARDFLRTKALLKTLIHLLEAREVMVSPIKKDYVVITADLNKQLEIELKKFQEELDKAVEESNKPHIIMPDKGIVKAV